jgi:hypothetical protein
MGLAAVDYIFSCPNFIVSETLLRHSDAPILFLKLVPSLLIGIGKWGINENINSSYHDLSFEYL